jgi:hypothetical protein
VLLGLTLGLALGPLCTATATATAPAGAAGAAVSTDPTGAHVVLVRNRVWVEVGPRRGQGAGAVDGCRRRWVPATAPYYLRPSRQRGGDIHPVAMPPAPSDAHRAYHVFCDGTYVTSVWLLPSAFLSGPALDPRAMAERLARDLPYPAATLGATPSARGLTGLESWFWVAGYSGAPIADAVEGFGLLVEVEARPGAATWSFGDGTAPARGTLGLAPPARSDVRHVFEQSSHGTPFTLAVTVRLDVRYRVNGGSWESLTPVLRTATRQYAVAESRAALVP